MKLVPYWRNAHKLWTVQIAVFWAAVSGLWVALPAFQGVVQPIPFACACIAISIALGLARLTHQPGVSDV